MKSPMPNHGKPRSTFPTPPTATAVLWACSLILTSMGSPTLAAADLYKDFADPPATARPMVRWVWMANRVTREMIVRDLDALKAQGFGGVEISTWGRGEPLGKDAPGSFETLSFGGWQDPKTPSAPFLTRPWAELVKFACDEAARRGMIADLLISNGWIVGDPETVGPARVQRYVHGWLDLEGPRRADFTVAELIERTKEGIVQKRTLPSYDAVLDSLRLAPASEGRAFEPGTDLLPRIDRAAGKVIFEVPPGRYRLHFGVIHRGFACAHGGIEDVPNTIINFYDREGPRWYFEKLGRALHATFGPQPMGGRLRALFSESIEMSWANWAEDVPAEFQRRRRYDLTPYLPYVFTMETLEAHGAGGAVLRRARHDLYLTLGELLNERYVGELYRFCDREGLQSRVQTYGVQIYDPIAMGRAAHIPEGDVWLFHNYKTPNLGSLTPEQVRYRIFPKWASSAAHLTGRPVASSEAMTAPKFYVDTLERVKAADDLSFISGINFSIGQLLPCYRDDLEWPLGMIYGPFSRRNTLWPHVRLWTDYNARLSAVFQRSRWEAEVAILEPQAGVQARFGFARNEREAVCAWIYRLWEQIGAAGASADFLNEAALRDAEARGGELCIGPMRYAVLMLADVASLQPGTVLAVRRFAERGGKVIIAGQTPRRVPGMAEAEAGDAFVASTMAALLRDHPASVTSLPAPKKGNAPLPPADLLRWTRAAFAAVGFTPPLALAEPSPLLFQIHHRDGDRRLVFLANAADRASWRGTLDVPAARGQTIWRWDTESGRREVLADGSVGGPLALELDPLESALLVYEPLLGGKAFPSRPRPAAEPLATVAGPWNLSLKPAHADPFSLTLDALIDFAEAKDERLRTFGGEALYRASFTVEGATRPAFIQIANCSDVVEVTVNGRSLGTRWYRPYVFPLGEAVRPGRNEIEIRLTTTLFNAVRLLAPGDPRIGYWIGSRRGLGLDPETPVACGLIGPVTLHLKRDRQTGAAAKPWARQVGGIKAKEAQK